ncbi:Extracellular metalloprotease [Lasiodiplodia hormozganensis]|uniref:Extracellular metalloprotease n=1 Tax=Lasiodiplodia hormozganensis TaxID=869390 RepID=A0AA39Y3V3_9PEZI|nr:Extracellular metalloprotease [Lasiodiplodia hormozganensis]
MVRLVVPSIALAAFASCAAATGRLWTGPCGTRPEVAKRSIGSSGIKIRQAANNGTNSTATIDLYYHVILAEGNSTTDFITDDLLNHQTEILNDGFVPMGYQFRLAETTWTTNASWFYNATQLSQQETDMKTALRKGDKTALNVYIVGLWDSSISAWSTVPLELDFNIPNDGVVLHNSILPGGANKIWTLGKTLIHEAGHWVGLYHTFSGGCENNFDYVDDTPLEAVPAASWDALGGCPEGRDTCPDAPGLDPIHNYMDYTSDECRTEFTPGQIAFAHNEMETHRGIFV